MHLSTRKQEILALLKEKQSLSVSDLIQHFEVAPATIRRDIASLAEENLITRTRGEIHLPAAEIVPAVWTRNTLHSNDKQMIAAAAAQLVHNGSTILLDSGSTTLALAQRLMDKTITAVTNSLDVAYVLANTAATVISSGGLLHGQHMCFLGPDAEKFMENIEVDLLFLGATGIRGSSGLTTSSPLQYNLKQSMMKSAKQIYALFDLSKFHSANIYLFANFSEIDGIITTKPVAGSYEYEQLMRIKDQGVNIIFAA